MAEGLAPLLDHARIRIDQARYRPQNARRNDGVDIDGWNVHPDVRAVSEKVAPIAIAATSTARRITIRSNVVRSRRSSIRIGEQCRSDERAVLHGAQERRLPKPPYPVSAE